MGCNLSDEKDAAKNNESIRVLIIGSAEHPDPVLEMVQELEKKGIH